jgi:flagellar hook-length control protein FliK
MPAIASLLPGTTPPVQPLMPIATGESLSGFADLFGNAAAADGKALPGAPTKIGKQPAREVLPTLPDARGEASDVAAEQPNGTAPTTGAVRDGDVPTYPDAPALAAPILFTPILGMTWIVPTAPAPAPAASPLVIAPTVTAAPIEPHQLGVAPTRLDPVCTEAEATALTLATTARSRDEATAPSLAALPPAVPRPAPETGAIATTIAAPRPDAPARPSHAPIPDAERAMSGPLHGQWRDAVALGPASPIAGGAPAPITNDTPTPRVSEVITASAVRQRSAPYLANLIAEPPSQPAPARQRTSAGSAIPSDLPQPATSVPASLEAVASASPRTFALARPVAVPAAVPIDASTPTPATTSSAQPITVAPAAAQPIALPFSGPAAIALPPALADRVGEAVVTIERPVRATSAPARAPAPAPDTAALLGARPAAPARTVSAVALPADRIDAPAPAPVATTPPGPAPLHIDAPQLPLDLARHTWPSQMLDRIERLRDAVEAVSTSIRVIPDALGAIDVSVRKEGEVTHVHLAADQPQTRVLLAEASPKLAELAEARGIKLGQSEVGGGSASTGGQQSAPQQQTARQPAAARTARAQAARPDDSRIA